MRQLRYTTRSGIAVTRTASRIPYKRGLEGLLRELDTHRGFYLSSGYEYPGRYSRWDIASARPPLEIIAAGREMQFRALNTRGEMLCRMLMPVLRDHPHWETFDFGAGGLIGRLKPLPPLFPEEERSKQPSAFSILRALIQEFGTPKDGRLALVGAFGYDLLFQFDPIERKLPRSGEKDLHLFLCDDIFYMDRKREVIERYEYDFDYEGLSTLALPRSDWSRKRLALTALRASVKRGLAAKAAAPAALALRRSRRFAIVPLGGLGLACRGAAIGFICSLLIRAIVRRLFVIVFAHVFLSRLLAGLPL